MLILDMVLVARAEAIWSLRNRETMDRDGLKEVARGLRITEHSLYTGFDSILDHFLGLWSG